MKKKLTLITLVLILLLAAFLRLYRISDYMTFLGDEGRDVIVAREMLGGNLTLLGPRSSAGDFFMGPAYYYMITPWLWLFQYDPVGPAVMVALFGVLTVFLIYYVGKKWFNERAGLFAAALYAVSPLVLTYSHSSWNPNVLPFFSLLMLYLLYKAIQAEHPWKYFLIAGLLLGISLQLHYLALFLCVVVFLYTFFGQWYQDKRINLLPVIKHYLLLLAGFVIGFSPFLAFEVRHGFPNTQTIARFIFGDTLQAAESHTGFLAIIGDIFFRVFGRLVFYYPAPDKYFQFTGTTLQIFAGFVIIMAISSLVSLRFVKDRRVVLLTVLWFVFGVGLFGLYKKSIYDYHFTFLFPLPFLLFGNFLSQLMQVKKWRRLFVILASVIFAGVFIYNLTGMPFRYEPNRQKNQVKTISEFVLSKTDGKPFNFALISSGNSDHAYRYYFDYLGHKPVTIDNDANDPDRKSVTDQLLVVCEDPSCKPLGHPLFDVAAFGRAELSGEWSVSVVKVYRLVHYHDGKSTH